MQRPVLSKEEINWLCTQPKVLEVLAARTAAIANTERGTGTGDYAKQRAQFLHHARKYIEACIDAERPTKFDRPLYRITLKPNDAFNLQQLVNLRPHLHQAQNVYHMGNPDRRGFMLDPDTLDTNGWVEVLWFDNAQPCIVTADKLLFEISVPGVTEEHCQGYSHA